ncbi:hypothetical protein [[Ruminococcus] torques]|uniref:hypothetical protein n=1 Tax=[Ruminococcus] torques TaxID=33039 RepID=UPI001EDE1DBF|nr:hypothetical protein [[Ruminococcus] torques]MCG4501264.1 hypothetical protein [[Ruminococcus] torques]
MEITKELLSTYRSKKDEIVELDWMLNNRWRSETMIGNDVIFDYSKGYPMPQSVVGFDQEKYDRAQERDLRKKKELEQECVEIEEWVEAITDSITRRIFRMCFIEGRRQKDVAKAVHMDRSNVSKRIDTYLQLSHNSHDSHV